MLFHDAQGTYTFEHDEARQLVFTQLGVCITAYGQSV